MLAGVSVKVQVKVVVYFFAYFVVEPGTSNEILVLAASTLSPQLPSSLSTYPHLLYRQQP